MLNVKYECQKDRDKDENVKYSVVAKLVEVVDET